MHFKIQISNLLTSMNPPSCKQFHLRISIYQLFLPEICNCRERLIRSCWTVDHTKRPSAPEIVEFLATNPRLLFPCLDVPLSSVQLEHTGQMEIQLTEDGRKFSFPASWPSQSSKSVLPFLSTTKPSPDSSDVNVDRDSKVQDQNNYSLLSAQCAEQESVKPLLSQSDCSSKYVEQRNGEAKAIPGYVNVQPSIMNFFKKSNNNSNLDIQLNERKTEASGSRDFNNISFL